LTKKLSQGPARLAVGKPEQEAERKLFMNRFKILLVTTALLMGSSALASAEEYHKGAAVEVRFDHDRYRDDHFRRVYISLDHRWLDANGRWCYDNNYWRFDARFGWVRR
jgi:hypothetical protein